MPLPPPDHLCSRDFTAGGFQPHGEFSCWMENGLLVWQARGPFNLEALQAYGRTRQAAFARWQLDDKPLAAILHWVGSALMSPEAFTHYERSFAAFIESRHHYVAVAWVGGPDIEGLDFMRSRFAPMFDRHGLAFNVFTDLDAARLWALPRLQQAGQITLP